MMGNDVRVGTLAILAVLVLALGSAGTAQSRTRVESVVGTASWYGAFHEGMPMANGQPFRRHALTAASKSIPLGTRLLVRHLRTGRSVVVTITDRGPYVPGRFLDLSEAAADRIGMHEAGTGLVSIERLPSGGGPRHGERHHRR